MIIYKTTNKINGKIYIGKTLKTLEKRKSEHLQESRINRKNSHLYNAIRKHGWENFEWYIIDKSNDNHVLSDLEYHYIKQYKSNNINFGYNKTDGGEGMSGWHQSEKCIENMKTNNPMYKREVIERMSMTKSKRDYGDKFKWDKKFSKEECDFYKKRQSDFMKNNNPMHNPDVVEKRKRTMEKNKNKNKIVDSLSKKWLVIDKDGNEFTIKNMSKFCRENNLSSGNMSNVANGKIESHKGYKCKKIEQ